MLYQAKKKPPTSLQTYLDYQVYLIKAFPFVNRQHLIELAFKTWLSSRLVQLSFFLVPPFQNLQPSEHRTAADMTLRIIQILPGSRFGAMSHEYGIENH